MSETFNLETILSPQATGVEYKEVQNYGGKLWIGSLDSADMIEWVESNDDPVKKREGGLRLIVKSITSGPDTGHARVPKDKFEIYLEAFRRKNSKENGKLVKEILILNGLANAAAKVDAKNGSSEVNTDASPAGSPSPSGE